LPLREESFDYLERELAGGAFAVGERLSVADIAIGAQLITYRQGGGDLPAARWPRLAALFDDCLRRPAWTPIMAEEEAALAAARARLA
jgi:glutathione S-transferase